MAQDSGLAAEKAYVRRIEKKFLSLRDGGLVVSPRDFALLLDWYQRGVPAEVVVSAIDEVFRRAEERAGGRSIRSIAFCRHAVEEAWRERRAALTGSSRSPSAAARGTLTPREIEAHLERAAARLREVASRARSDAAHGADRLEAIASRLAAIREEIRRSPPASFERTEEEMAGLEAESLAAGREILPPIALETITREAEERIEPFVSRMSEKARGATRRRAVDAAIREHLGMPRLSLFTIAL